MIRITTVLSCILIIAGCGCVITVESGERYPDEVIVYGDPVIDATMAEIDAVSKLDFDSNKVNGFMQIAMREPLLPPCQEHLVGAVFGSLDFEQSKKKVLVALIRNRTFSFEGKRAILNRLERLDFDSTKQDILNELNRRGPLVPVTEEVVIISP